MGCAPCQAAALARANASAARIVQNKEVVSSEECEFTIEQISEWYDRVNCVRTQGLYLQIPNITTKQINIYVGTLSSAKNYADKICYFRRELEEVESFITVLTALDLCKP